MPLLGFFLGLLDLPRKPLGGSALGSVWLLYSVLFTPSLGRMRCVTHDIHIRRHPILGGRRNGQCVQHRSVLLADLAIRGLVCSKRRTARRQVQPFHYYKYRSPNIVSGRERHSWQYIHPGITICLCPRIGMLLGFTGIALCAAGCPANFSTPQDPLAGEYPGTAKTLCS